MDFNSIFNDLQIWSNALKIEQISVKIIIVLLILIVGIISSGTLSYGIIKLFNIKNKEKNLKKSAFYKPLKIFLIIISFYISFVILELPVSLMNIISKIVRILIIMLIAKGIANILSPKSIIFDKILKNDKYKENKQSLEFFSKIIKIIVYIIAAFIIISEFGYNLNGIVTGLGLGSVVVALAAQDIAKSLLAGAVILLDKPFEIGDYVEVKGYGGTVENIKFRSTRIRLLDGTLLNVPNEVLMTETIDNYNKMERRRFETNLELVLDTDLNKVRKIIEIFKQELERIEGVIPGSVKVHFNVITENGMNIFIYLDTTKTKYDMFLDLKQEANLKIMEILEKEGVSLAYKSQDIYIRK